MKFHILILSVGVCPLRPALVLFRTYCNCINGLGSGVPSVLRFIHYLVCFLYTCHAELGSATLLPAYFLLSRRVPLALAGSVAGSVVSTSAATSSKACQAKWWPLMASLKSCSDDALRSLCQLCPHQLERALLVSAYCSASSRSFCVHATKR